ncbi:restriction endonuclease subunit S [Mycoplasma anatis]|uniref:Restriction endonuclease subunit S n=1 Tax=Mycoplasmopsis anatis TaxID=171279 RepID=A0A9Q3L9P5_9BACT|nr:restriction endonuclease subunit S [Mycoplasmopsis anatis]MBW0602661.1 restriction endonuclease subunit S [Mycoplasmopsis anatis]
MNKIWDLIKNEKVEWKTIGEVCKIRKGEYITKKQANEFGEFPVVSGGVNPSYYHNKYNRDINTITIGASGINAGYVNFWDTKIFLSDAYSLEPKDNIVNKYLYHFLLSKQEDIFGMRKGAGIPHVYSADFSMIKIPIPSIDTQNKIVKILDKFNIYVKELERELERRNKQYQHYRDMLLSENYLNSNCRNNLMNVDREIKWKKLGEFCEIGTGSSNRKDEVSDGMYPFFVRSKNILRSNKYEFDETAIIIPGEGGIGEIFHFIEGKYSLHQRAYRIKVLDTNINTKFIYHYLTNWFKEYILNIAVGTTAASIRKPMIEDFEIPIPSLDIQNRIVKILDKFSELSENTKGLLPKEIQQRQEQYKYYRDKLLVFDNTHNPERERERRCGATK